MNNGELFKIKHYYDMSIQIKRKRISFEKDIRFLFMQVCITYEKQSNNVDKRECFITAVNGES